MSEIELHTYKKSANFTIVSNAIIEADYLQLEDKGLLIWFLSRPLNWLVNTKSLCTIHKVSKNKITAISKRLQEAGHLIIERFKDGCAKWHFFELRSDYDAATKGREEDQNKPYPQNEYEAIKKPYPQKPDIVIEDALTSTDLITRTDHPLQNENQISEVIDHEFQMLGEISGFTGDIQNEYFKFLGHLASKQISHINRARKLGEWRKWIGRAKGYQKAPAARNNFNKQSKFEALDLDDQTWAENIRLKI